MAVYIHLRARKKAFRRDSENIILVFLSYECMIEFLEQSHRFDRSRRASRVVVKLRPTQTPFWITYPAYPCSERMRGLHPSCSCETEGF